MVFRYRHLVSAFALKPSIIAQFVISMQIRIFLGHPICIRQRCNRIPGQNRPHAGPRTAIHRKQKTLPRFHNGALLGQQFVDGSGLCGLQFTLFALFGAVKMVEEHQRPYRHRAALAHFPLNEPNRPRTWLRHDHGFFGHIERKPACHFRESRARIGRRVWIGPSGIPAQISIRRTSLLFGGI